MSQSHPSQVQEQSHHSPNGRHAPQVLPAQADAGAARFAPPRLGIVVPPENPTAEPEFDSLVGGVMHTYTSRFPMVREPDLHKVLEAWNDALPATLDNFGSLRLDVAVVACSASHYLLSPDGDRRFCDELSARAGFPVQSSPQAILAACGALGAERLTMVSPYETWLTDVSRGYWENAGLTVDRVVRVRAGDRFDPYRVTTEDILREVDRQGLPEDATVLFTGTGMYTLAAMGELAGRSDRVLLSSNLACAWWALRTTAPGRRWSDLDPLLSRLHRQLAA